MLSVFTDDKAISLETESYAYAREFVTCDSTRSVELEVLPGCGKLCDWRHLVELRLAAAHGHLVFWVNLGFEQAVWTEIEPLDDPDFISRWAPLENLQIKERTGHQDEKSLS